MKGNIMNTETAAMAVPVVNDPAIINTAWGAVMVYGHEHVSKKDLIILTACLNLPEFTGMEGIEASNHNVKSVVFRADNRPQDGGVPIFGNVSFDHGAIGVNVFHIVASAIKDAQDHPEVAILASYHRNLITTWLHEINHLATLDDIPKDPEMVDKAEEEAEVWSKDTLSLMAKSIDIEPAHHAESSVLANQLMELLSEKDDKWSINQRDMLNNHIMYRLPETDTMQEVALNTFKEFIRMQSDDAKDPDWDKPTIEANGPVPSMVQYAAEQKAIAPQDLFGSSSMPDENMMDWDFEAAQASMPDSEPAMPMSVVGLSPTPTPAFTGFPVSNGFPANPGFVQPTPTPTANQAMDIQIYPKTGLSMEATAEVVKGVYFKCYQHLFGVCGRRMDSDKAFDFPERVYLMGIPLTPLEMQVVVRMDCQDTNERFCGKMETSGGKLFGQVFSRTKLPAYKLYINMDGVERCRLLLPQNTAKPDGNGGLSKTALQARAGSCIMYIKEGNDAIIKAGGKTWLHKIVDNQFLPG